MAPTNINQKRLVQIFKDVNRVNSEIRFCFLIGAGASVSSGIPSGTTLSKRWYQRLEKDLPEDELQEWEEEIGFQEKRIGEFYPQIYDKRFESSAQVGYDTLKDLMHNQDPSIGYVILSQILFKEKHNFVITTNFDYLIEDAVRMYTPTQPFSAGHETLASFVSSQTEQPTIIKVHRDLFFNPLNDEDGTDSLKTEWKEALRPILRDFNLLVLGYGGNDRSLMKYLNEINSENRKPIYWCKREQDTLSDMIKDLLTDDDYIVTINDFDELMYALHDALEYETFEGLENIEEHEFVKNAQKRVQNLNVKLREILKNRKDSGIEESGESLFKGALDYMRKVQETDNLEEKEKIFLEGINEHQNSTILLEEYAKFNFKYLNDFEKADEYYQKAIKTDPENARILGNYAQFLTINRKNLNKAEKLYQKSLDIDSNQVRTLGNYAVFLNDCRKSFDDAKKLYQKALNVDPNDARNLGNYANHLNNVRSNFNKAEEFYKRALQINSEDPLNLGNYAHFLIKARSNKEKAKRLIDKVFKLKPEEKPLLAELWFYRYAHYEDYFDEAENELEKLIEEGVKSLGWDLQSHVDIAKENGHPNPEKLQEFADAITEPED